MNAIPGFLLSEKIYFFWRNPHPLSAILDFPHSYKVMSKGKVKAVLQTRMSNSFGHNLHPSPFHSHIQDVIQLKCDRDATRFHSM